MTVPRWQAFALVALLVATVVAACWTESARSQPPAGLRAAYAVRHEFGTGWLAGCFLAIAHRETGGTYNPRAANWTDHHADGSVGSFGLFQIGALWRRPGEPVAEFARRMFNPAEAARLAHQIWRRYGLQPWGGSCS